MSHNIISKVDVLDPTPTVVDKTGKVLILVDYSNLLYRAYFSSLKDLEIRPWMPFIRALDMLRTCVKHVKGHTDTQIQFIFCGDTVRKKLDRMRVDESYKEERPSLTNLNFYIFRNVMSYVIKDLGCEIIQHEGAEGDDVIASLVHKFSKQCDCDKPCVNCRCAEQDPYSNIVIFSCDRDLDGLLQYRGVLMYRPPHFFYTSQDFLDEFGFNPKLYGVYKSLVGDKSDGIKGVTLWGDVRAKKHIEQGNWEETLTKEGKLDEFGRAMALVTLRTDIPDLPDKGFEIKVGGCPEMFEKLRAEYHKKDAADDVVFYEQRLERACQNDGGNDDVEQETQAETKVEEDLPF